MYLYKTVYEYAEVEIVIEKSRFIARVMPIDTYEEGQAFVAEMKEKYKNATHNVPAIIFGRKQEMQWASDDGEPSGTSGMPMLKLLNDLELTNVAVVVTRYFGGVKLGTGGLSRAYSSLAKAGVEAAGICGVAESTIFGYRIEYSHYPKIENAIKGRQIEIDSVSYTSQIDLKLSFLSKDEEEVENLIQNLTLGQAVKTSEQRKLRKFKINVDTE